MSLSPPQSLSLPRSAAQKHESTLLLACIKQHTEAAEERLNARLLQSQSHQDLLQQAVVAQLEEKLSRTEAAYPRLDHKVAELAGSVKGLLDEVQKQVRRADAIDERWWQCRHQIEEKYRTKWQDIETQLQSIATIQRLQATACEEQAWKLGQRLLQLENGANRYAQLERSAVSERGFEASALDIPEQGGVKMPASSSTDVAEPAQGRDSRTAAPAAPDIVDRVALLESSKLDFSDLVDSSQSLREQVERHAEWLKELEKQQSRIVADVALLQAGDPKLIELATQLQDVGPAVMRLRDNVEEVRAWQASAYMQGGDDEEVSSTQSVAKLWREIQDLKEERSQMSEADPHAQLAAEALHDFRSEVRRFHESCSLELLESSRKVAGVQEVVREVKASLAEFGTSLLPSMTQSIDHLCSEMEVLKGRVDSSMSTSTVASHEQSLILDPHARSQQDLLSKEVQGLAANLEEVRLDMAALHLEAGAAGRELPELREELRRLKAPALSSDDAAAAALETSALVAGLEGDMKELKQELLELRVHSRFEATSGNEKLFSLQKDVTELQAKVSNSTSQLPREQLAIEQQLQPSSSRPSPEGKLGSFNALVAALKRDEELEGQAFEQLLATIEAVCQRLDALDAAIGSIPPHGGASLETRTPLQEAAGELAVRLTLEPPTPD